MNLILQTILIIVLLLITKQDLKERKVTLLLFMFSGLLLGYLHFSSVETLVFLVTAASNIFIVILIVLILKLYANLKLKLEFKETFGLGDALFFIVMAVGFPTATFIVLFSFSLLFTAVLFFLMKKKLRFQTIPLAGFQALFLSIVFVLNASFHFVELYTI